MTKLTFVALAASAALFPLGTASAAPPTHGSAGASAHHSNVRVMRHHGPRMKHSGPNVRRFFHGQRFGRGAFVPHFWWGPQFQVRHWNMYGFPQPFAGGRWIRYYDDALLIDRYGRVHDGRYGWDWDRYGDHWREDERGIPVYVGDGDFEPDERDYEWAEDYEERGAPRQERAYRHGPPLPPGCGNPCTQVFHGPPPPLPHPPAHGWSYGYGCGCGPVVVTETITTTAPVMETRTYYVTERAKPAPRRTWTKPVRRAPPPPKPGERG